LESKRLTNYTTDDVGIVADVFRLAQAAGDNELALNGSAIALPPTPKLELFYGIEPHRTIGYACVCGFFDDPILTLPRVIGIALIDPQSRALLLRIHLENDKAHRSDHGCGVPMTLRCTGVEALSPQGATT
jgi:hypothetical protein